MVVTQEDRGPFDPYLGFRFPTSGAEGLNIITASNPADRFLESGHKLQCIGATDLSDQSTETQSDFRLLAKYILY